MGTSLAASLLLGPRNGQSPRCEILGLSLSCARGELNQRDPTLATLDVGHLSVDRQSRCLPLGTVPGRSCYPG